MQFHHNRLRSYSDSLWPHPNTAGSDTTWKATPESLATAGFYYDPIPSARFQHQNGGSGIDDRVACYICNVVISNWRPNQDPMARHRQEYVECPVVTSQRSDCRLTSTEAKAARRATFGKWWPHKATLLDGTKFWATPAKLAEAGFVYHPTAEHEDGVQCVWCKLQHHSWAKKNVDPMYKRAHCVGTGTEIISAPVYYRELHKEKSRDCPFVHEIMGNDLMRTTAISGTISPRSSTIESRRNSLASSASAPVVVPAAASSRKSRFSAANSGTFSANHSPERSPPLVAPEAITAPTGRRIKTATEKWGSRESLPAPEPTTKKRKTITPAPRLPENGSPSSLKLRQEDSVSVASSSYRRRKASPTNTADLETSSDVKEMLNHILAVGEKLKLSLEQQNLASVFASGASDNNELLRAAQLRISELTGYSSRLVEEKRQLMDTLDGFYDVMKSNPAFPLPFNDAARAWIDGSKTRVAASKKQNADEVKKEKLIKSLNLEKAELSKAVETHTDRYFKKCQEFDKLHHGLTMLRNECDAWKASWETMKKENDILRGIGPAPVQPPLSHHSAVLLLPPAHRRTWHEGENYLFEIRIGVLFAPTSGRELSLEKAAYLTCADIPWPVSPSTPANSIITTPMISTFLLSDLGAEDQARYVRQLMQRFELERVKRWLPCVVEKERQRVVTRSQEVLQALTQLVHH